VDGQSSERRRVFTAGKSAGPLFVWTTSSRLILRALFNVTVIPCTAPLPMGEAATIELADCWAHVRQKFHEALEQSPKTAGWVMWQIQNLYRVEARLREGKTGP